LQKPRSISTASNFESDGKSSPAGRIVTRWPAKRRALSSYHGGAGGPPSSTLATLRFRGLTDPAGGEPRPCRADSSPCRSSARPACSRMAVRGSTWSARHRQGAACADVSESA
jgi:hypothetical protein